MQALIRFAYSRNDGKQKKEYEEMDDLIYGLCNNDRLRCQQVLFYSR